MSFAALMAAVLLVSVVAVAVGNHLGVFGFMERMSGVSGVLQDAAELVQTNLGSLSLQNTILTAEEAVYDGGNLRVVYSVQAKSLSAPLQPEDSSDPQSAFRRALESDGINPDGSCDWFEVNGVQYTMTNGSTGDAVFNSDSGKLFCYLDIQLASAGIIPKGDLTVKLPLAGEIIGRKTLDFTVKASTTQRPRASLQTEHATVTLLSAFLSPVRTYLSIRIEMKEGSTLAQADEVFEAWSDVLLTDAKGREISTPMDVLTANLEDGECVDYSYTFLPADNEEIFLTPFILDENNNWVGDRNQALRLK